MLSELEPALVHDYLLVSRGAERTFSAIASCWPGAPVFTLAYDRERVGHLFRGHVVATSWLQRLQPRQSTFRWLLPLCPVAVEQLPLKAHDVVLSSSSAFAHGVRCRHDALHISYCHIPFRYAWSHTDARRATPTLLWPVVRPSLRRIRKWDLAASRRVTHYLTNGRLSQRRIEEVYGRFAEIIPPPVDTRRFSIGKPEDYFLVVGEIVEHKAVEIAIKAAQLARVPLRIVGGGPDQRRLTARYGGRDVEFLGRVDDRRLEQLYRGARALVMPQIEDFGIVAVEAQASGRPVLAADAGGARETVLTGVTGVLVPPGDIGAMAEAMRYTDFDRFSPVSATQNASRFSVARFTERFRREVLRLAGPGRGDAQVAT